MGTSLDVILETGSCARSLIAGGRKEKEPQMLNYQIRYLTSDDRLALIYNTLQSDDRDAVRVARRPMRLPYKQFEVWRGDECVEKGINPRLPN